MTPNVGVHPEVQNWLGQPIQLAAPPRWYVDCLECDGTGRACDDDGCVTCRPCEGTGLVEEE